MSINENKYKNLIEYGFYAYSIVELQQLLYYVDFISYREYGETITGDVYIKKDFGAMGKHFNKMSQERDIINMNVFKAQEKIIINKVWRKFKYCTVEKITNQVKTEAPWIYTIIGQEMEYKYAKDIDIL
jgi:hypothetical protein